MSVPSRAAGAVPPRAFALTCALTAMLLSVGGLWLDTRVMPTVLGVDDPARVSPSRTLPVAGWGSVLALCYGTGLWLATAMARWVWRTRAGRRVIDFARTAVVIAVTAHLLEILLLLGAGPLGRSGVWMTGITAAATTKYGALLPAEVVALCGSTVLVWRCATHSAGTLARRAQRNPGIVPPSPVEGTDPPAAARTTSRANRWRNAYTVPGVDTELINERWNRGEHTTGVCLSGGGIRAATVALGALQSLRSELLEADYLTSVSGGGYTAGALQQALTDAGAHPRPGTALRDPASVFGSGTPELHHVRRHSSYLADTPGKFVGLLGKLATLLALSLLVLFGPALAVGLVMGWLYQWLPIGTLPAPSHPFPDPGSGTLLALGAITVAAFVLTLFARGEPARRRRSARTARELALLSGILAVLVLAIPLLVGAAVWLLSNTSRAVDIVGSVGSVVLTYLSTLAVIFWRHRDRNGQTPAAFPQGVIQRLLVIVTTGILVTLWIILVSAAATSVTLSAAMGIAVAVALAGLLLGALVDVTSLSLHPFYRERLARAFAVRPVRRHRDGQIVAVPYPAEERSTLSRYGSVPRKRKFPRVIFAAAANLTGQSRTPPGLNAVSFTMSGEWCGGPDVGWVRTDDLEDSVSHRIRRDLTVQAAVAVSGAAFASAMGRSSRWYQVLLAVSGARLGTWLPNPDFLRRAREASYRGDWTYPWLPRARHLPYLLREVFGVHSHQDPLLHVTDGSHYDTLGLVELFRRRCTRIFCIDASNATPEQTTALTHALTLASQELGVRVYLDDPWQMDPGSKQEWDPDNPLASRIAESPVVTGTIHYPAESGLHQEVEGCLVVARAVLWSDLPYPLLSYAARNPEFPHDSTSDQWFDHNTFSAYLELGRCLGAAARDAVALPQLPRARTGSPETTPRQ